MTENMAEQPRLYHSNSMKADALKEALRLQARRDILSSAESGSRAARLPVSDRFLFRKRNKGSINRGN